MSARRRCLQTLLKNVYRAFDFRDEEDVYDKLALSVSGDLLTDIYLQNRRSMAIQQAGGAQAKIKEVAVEAASAERVDGDGLTYALHGTLDGAGHRRPLGASAPAQEPLRGGGDRRARRTASGRSSVWS